MAKVDSQSAYTFDKQPAMILGALRLMCVNSSFLRKFAPILHAEHWPEFEAKWVISQVTEHYGQFKRAPRMPTMRMRLDADVKLKEEQEELLSRFLAKLDSLELDTATREYIEHGFENFCRYRATLQALREAKEYLQDDEQDKAVQVVQESAQVRLINDDWLYVPESLASYWDFFSEENLKEISVPTGLEPFDAKLGGGLRQGELGIWLAPTGFGKSMALVHCGAQAFFQGRLVLHFTFENSREETMARYAHHLLGVDSGYMGKLSPDHESFRRRQEELVAMGGSVRIMELIGARTTALDLESYFQRLEEDGERPGLVIVDYADFMTAYRKSALGGQRWEELAAIFEELRNLASEYDVPIWTATQANREGMKAKRVVTHHIAGSMGKANVADIIVSVSKAAKDKDGKEIRVKPRDEDGHASGNEDDEDDELDDETRILTLVKLRRGGTDNWWLPVKAHFAQAKFEILTGDEELERLERQIGRAAEREGSLRKKDATDAPE